MSLLTAQSECSRTWTKHDVLCSYTSYCTVALEKKTKKQTTTKKTNLATPTLKPKQTMNVKQFFSEVHNVLLFLVQNHYSCSVQKHCIIMQSLNISPKSSEADLVRSAKFLQRSAVQEKGPSCWHKILVVQDS